MKLQIGNKVIEVSDEEITKAIEEKKETLSITSDFIIRTPAEDKVFEKNKYEEGKQAGEEILIKETRDKLELKFEGKTMDNLITAFKEKTLSDAKIEPEEQLKKIKDQLSEKDKALQQALNDKDSLSKDFVKFKNNATIDRFLDSMIPENTILPKDDMKTLLRSKVNLNIDDKGSIFVLDALGQVVKNQTTADPMKADEFIQEFFKTNNTYIKPVQGGAGGKDSKQGAGSKQSMEEFIEEMREKGIVTSSEEFSKVASERIKNNLLDNE